MTQTFLSSWWVSVYQANASYMKLVLGQSQTPETQEYPDQHWENCPSRWWSGKWYWDIKRKSITDLVDASESVITIIGLSGPDCNNAT